MQTPQRYPFSGRYPEFGTQQAWFRLPELLLGDWFCLFILFFRHMDLHLPMQAWTLT